MTEDRARSWDAGLKLGTVIVSLLVATVGYRDYQLRAKESTDRARPTQDIAARGPFLEQRLKLYFEATETASKLATLEPGKAWDEAHSRFWQLYWGQLSVVESKAVASAMVNVGLCLKDKTCDRGELEQRSLRLAHACRDDIQAAWDVASLRKP
jgi:hypothetical protein